MSCTVSFSLISGDSSEFSEDCLYSRGSRSSLTRKPVDRVKQHSRRLSQDPPSRSTSRQADDTNRSSSSRGQTIDLKLSVICCKLSAININTGLCKQVDFVLFWIHPHRQSSEQIFPFSEY